MRDTQLLAVTPGEPAGIGPEILLKLAHACPELPLLAVADPHLLIRTAKRLRIPVEIVDWIPQQEAPHGHLRCWPVRLLAPERPGHPDPANARYVLATLTEAHALVREGRAAALVTGPVHKAVINEAGIPFSGHTEFLAQLGEVREVVMMLTAPGLRVALVTTHLPLRDVPAAVTAERIETVIRITDRALRTWFEIDRPRLQVLGLNPHAGESGHLGDEETRVISPTIARMRAEGLQLEGPVPADTAFTPSRLQACDAVVAMYHDQGLPVLKHAGFGNAVNITLGLPFIRTSVDHGTALDIAGTGKADEHSLRAAVEAAAAMVRRCAGDQTRASR